MKYYLIFVSVFLIIFCFNIYCQPDKIEFEGKVSNFENISPNIIRNYLRLEEFGKEFLSVIGSIKKLSPIKFSELRENIKIDSIFVGYFETYGPPYSAAGPYYFFKYNEEYYVLSPRNYSKIYAPIDTELESILYLEGLLKLRGFSFLHSSVIYSKYFHFEHYRGPKFEFPISKSIKKNNHFEIQLITYDYFSSLAIYKQVFKLDFSGIIIQESEEERIITLGNGLVY